MSKSTSHGAPTLTPEQLERLETLLWEHAVPRGGMSMEMLDGYFSALLCSPSLVMPSEAVGAIWGDPPPVWEDANTAAEAYHLVMGYWNHVADRLALDPDESAESAPAIALSETLHARLGEIVDTGKIPDDLPEVDRVFPVGLAWAIGFFVGVDLREDEWDRWAEAHDEVAEALDDIEQLMHTPPDPEGDVASDADAPHEDDDAGYDEDDDDSEGDEDDDDDGISAIDPPDLYERLDIVFELPHFLKFFDTLRRSEMIRAQGPARRTDGPGRNDPCPCGSGKKYKKCCGDPARLH